MARPPKVGQKKENISVSVTPTERESVQRRARQLGFSSASKYLLALHEAEQRLQLHVRANFEGERWFLLSLGDPVPEDTTVEKAIQALVADRDDLSKITPLPGAAAPAAASGFVVSKLQDLEQKKSKKAKPSKSPRPAH